MVEFLLIVLILLFLGVLDKAIIITLKILGMVGTIAIFATILLVALAAG